MAEKSVASPTRMRTPGTPWRREPLREQLGLELVRIHGVQLSGAARRDGGGLQEQVLVPRPAPTSTMLAPGRASDEPDNELSAGVDRKDQTALERLPPHGRTRRLRPRCTREARRGAAAPSDSQHLASGFSAADERVGRQIERCRRVVGRHDLLGGLAPQLLDPHLGEPHRMRVQSCERVHVGVGVAPREAGGVLGKPAQHGVGQAGRLLAHLTHEFDALVDGSTCLAAHEQDLVRRDAQRVRDARLDPLAAQVAVEHLDQRALGLERAVGKPGRQRRVSR